MMTTLRISIYVVFFLLVFLWRSPNLLDQLFKSKFQASHLYGRLSLYGKVCKAIYTELEISHCEKMGVLMFSILTNILDWTSEISGQDNFENWSTLCVISSSSWRYICMLDYSAVDYLNSRFLFQCPLRFISYWISHHLTFYEWPSLMFFRLLCWLLINERMIIVTLSTCKHLDKRELPSSNERDPHPSFTLLLVTCGRSLSY